MRRFMAFASLVLVAFVVGCGGDTTPKPSPPVANTPAVVALTVKSSGFDDGKPIPAEYTCDGRDASPPMTWTAVRGAESWAIVMVDTDAGFTHWAVWDLPAETMAFGTGQTATEPAREGRNSLGRNGYGGPCPPPGTPDHHYVFTVYALSGVLALTGGAPGEALLPALEGRIVAQASLTGTYGR